MTVRSTTPTAIVDVEGLVGELTAQRAGLQSRAVKHSRYGWIWNILGIVVLTSGVAATTIAGISAVGNLVSKTIIGVIAIAAAIFTAFGAAFPFSAIAVRHWRVSDDYELLGRKIGRTIRVIQADPPHDRSGVETWHKTMEELCKEEEVMRRRGERIALLWNTGKEMDEGDQRRRNVQTGANRHG